MSVETRASELRERSFTFVPELFDAETVARMRAVLGGVYDRFGSPQPYGEGVRWLDKNIEVSSTGFVVHKLLGFDPELARGILPRDAVEIVRGALGADMHLEMVAAVVSDHTRPFFQWHMHVGGIDDETYRRRGLRPVFEKPERVSMLVYLDPMSSESGQLLVYPRKITDPIAPPFPIEQQTWPGQVAVSGPAGSAAFMEQSTWHAVLPRRKALTPRMFVGFWFASASATRAERVDESLLELPMPDEVLSSVLPRARHV